MDLRLRTENLRQVAVDGRRVLFHVPSSGLFDLDDLSSSILDLLGDGRTLSGDALAAHFDSRYGRADLDEALAELTALNILETPAAHLPAARVEPPEGALSSLVLNVTTGCNLSCTYCYKEDLASPAAARRLSSDAARAAVDLLLKESGGRPRVNISFFGGEPLSNMGLIRDVVAYAEERTQAAGRSVDFSLTTNATLLDDDLIAWLDAHRFGLSVSMDGPEAVHDRNRRTLGGQGTYRVVADKVRRLLEVYRSRPVGARVTVTSGATDVLAIHHHLKNEMGFAEVGIAPVTAGLPAGFHLDEAETATVFDGMLTLAGRYRDAALEGRDIGFSNMTQLINSLHQGDSKLVPCGAGHSLLAVDTEGGLQLCHRFTGSSLGTFGDVAGGIDRRRVADFLGQAATRAEAACAGCPARHLCAGGCYHESYTRHGDPFRPTDHYCDLIRRWIMSGIAIYAEIMAKNPRFLAHQGTSRRADR